MTEDFFEYWSAIVDAAPDKSPEDRASTIVGIKEALRLPMDPQEEAFLREVLRTIEGMG